MKRVFKIIVEEHNLAAVTNLGILGKPRSAALEDGKVEIRGISTSFSADLYEALEDNGIKALVSLMRDNHGYSARDLKDDEFVPDHEPEDYTLEPAPALAPIPEN